MARREGYAAVPQVKTFWDSLLDSVKAHGRVFELGKSAAFLAPASGKLELVCNSAITTTGPEVMNLHRSLKKGRSRCTP